jgi:hypothetical protein
VPDNRHSSIGICPITAWHGNSSMRTRIITMITLTSDKLTPIKVGFSIKDLVHQGPGWPMPRKIVHPRGFTPPGKAVKGRTILYSATGWDDSCQKALYPHLSARLRRPVYVVV